MRSYTLSLLAGLALSVAACGNDDDKYDFRGSWSGILAVPAARCSDGSFTQSEATPINVNIVSSGEGQLIWRAACGDIPLSQMGNVAVQTRGITCASQITPSGKQVTPAIRNSSVTHTGSALQVSMTFDYFIAGAGVQGTCIGVNGAGTFVRQGGSLPDGRPPS